MRDQGAFILKTLAALALTGLLIYTGFWFYLAGEIKKQAETAIRETTTSEIVIITRKLNVGNYPFMPEIVFEGRISARGQVVEIPLLKIRSLFLPGKKISLHAPKGFYMAAPADPALYALDSVRIDSVIPETLPVAATHEDMTAWRDAGGAISISAMTIAKGDLKLSGSGMLKLDEALQPSGTIAARATGHMDFLNWLRGAGYIDTKTSILSAAVLAGLSRIDEKSGENTMDVTLTLQNRTLFAGPLRLAYLPEIPWAWRSGPDRLR